MNKLYVSLAIVASFGFGTIFGANKILKYQRDYVDKFRKKEEHKARLGKAAYERGLK